jgi:hypothetical protein
VFEGVDIGLKVGVDEGELVRVTTMPFVSVVSDVPVNVAVIMSVVNVPAKCS